MGARRDNRVDASHEAAATGADLQGAAGEAQVLLAIVGGGRDGLWRGRVEQAPA